MNQALFERLYVEDVRAVFAEPFRTIYDELVAVEAKDVSAERRSDEGRQTEHGRFTAQLDAALRRRGRGSRTNKPALCRYGAGLSDSSLVPQARVELATFRLGGGCSIH